jgi:hypothetical protein
VRGLLLPLSLILAAAATAGLVLIVMRSAGAPAPEPPAAGAGRADAPPQRPALQQRELRPYATTLTLVEDLRDALPGPPAVLEREVWRVSRALKSRANWTLEKLARQEASPRVRALLVLAAGVHRPDAAALLRFLSDAHPVVRTAAVLACGHLEGGPVEAPLFGALRVPVGRRPEDATRASLEEAYGREHEAAVRAAIDAVLSPAR